MNLNGVGVLRLAAHYEELQKQARRSGPRARVLGSVDGRCGAYARSTQRLCRAKALDNGRCKLHGGRSTGPKTTEGKRRCAENLKIWREQIKAQKSV